MSFEKDTEQIMAFEEEEDEARENIEEEDLNFGDDTANYIFQENEKPKNVKQQKKYASVEKRLENATSQRFYYAVCKKIEERTHQLYSSEVISNFDFLLENQELVQIQYGTKNDYPNGEWIIDSDNADAQTLEKEIRKLQIKIKNVSKENSNLNKKKNNLEKRLQDARNENQRLQNEIEWEQQENEENAE